jgi:hypothetical protein
VCGGDLARGSRGTHAAVATHVPVRWPVACRMESGSKPRGGKAWVRRCRRWGCSGAVTTSMTVHLAGTWTQPGRESDPVAHLACGDPPQPTHQRPRNTKTRPFFARVIGLSIVSPPPHLQGQSHAHGAGGARRDAVHGGAAPSRVAAGAAAPQSNRRRARNPSSSTRQSPSCTREQPRAMAARGETRGRLSRAQGRSTAQQLDTLPTQTARRWTVFCRRPDPSSTAHLTVRVPTRDAPCDALSLSGGCARWLVRLEAGRRLRRMVSLPSTE